MRARAGIFFLGLVSTALTAAAEIEFTGVLSAAGGDKFAFHDTTTGVSRWIALKGSFGDYTLISYDAKQETAVLTKNNVSLRLHLDAAKVRAGTGANQPLTLVQAKTVFGNLRMLAAAADQYYLATGRKSATFAEVTGPGWGPPDQNYGKRIAADLKSVSGEDYSAIKFDQNTLVFTAKTASGETITLDLVHDDVGQAKTSTFYTVRAGDTLFQIGRAAGTTPEELAKMNEFKSPASLRIGELLRIH